MPSLICRQWLMEDASQPLPPLKSALGLPGKPRFWSVLDRANRDPFAALFEEPIYW